MEGAARSSRVPKIEKAAIERNFGRTLEDAAKQLGVHKSTLKRSCRAYGIKRWPSHMRNSGTSNYTVSVKATYRNAEEVFDINSDMEIQELVGILGNVFGLEVGSFRIVCKDKDGDLITITDDLKEAMDELHLSGIELLELQLVLDQWSF